MTDSPAVNSAEHERPHHGPEGNPPGAATHTRSRRKKVLVPLVLAVIGLALLAFGLGMYPRRAEAPAPTYASVGVYGVSGSSYALTHLGQFFYTVDQVKPDLAKVIIGLDLSDDRPPPGERVEVLLDAGGHRIVKCSPSPGCYSASSGGFAFLAITPGVRFFSADFLVRARSFGTVSNGATAAAVLPSISFGEAARQTFGSISYQIPSASSYDWSSYPPGFVSSSAVTWSEPLQSLATQPRVVTGTDHAAQQRDSNFTLIAGILFGIAGGALIAAVQEALHD